VLGAIAAVITILAAALGGIRWLRGRDVQVSSEGRFAAERLIEDMWVDLRYIEDASVAKRLRDQGYRIYCSSANDEARRVNLEGWEVVVDQMDDGRRVRYKVRDHPVVGGYLVPLRGPDGDQTSRVSKLPAAAAAVPRR